MKRIILIALAVAFALQIEAQSYERTGLGIKTTAGSTDVEIQFYTPEIIRVLKYPTGKAPEKKSLAVTMSPEKVDFGTELFNNVVVLTTKDVTVQVNTYSGDVSFTGKDTRPFIAEKSYASLLIPKQYESGSTYEVKQTFLLDKQEAVYGLGQHQQGAMSQRGKEVWLRQANTEIAVPIIHSVKGYAIYWDNYSPTLYKDSYDGLSFSSESGQCIDYYFMYGGNADGVIAQIRNLTGQAPMFPLWTYGFWQSRERYVSQEELVATVSKYRDLKVPLDGIVQDWQYWSTDFKHWNAVEFGNPEFPNPKKMIDDVHKLNAHIIISVWPSFGPNTNIYKELKNKKLLFDFETFPQDNGTRVYDAFNPEARNIYWDYMNKNIFSIDMDGWWLDATEPENSTGEKSMDEKTYLGAFRDVANAYPLLSVGGVYDKQREVSSDKRVFILTRSAFAGQQRYGANSWSGDIVSRWDVLRDQISAGLNFSLCGIPYWNTDIGGFWANRVYPEGIKDIAYHELYVRWLQFGTFMPMMRSHGTNTPREIFQFGQKGDWAYDAQEKFIRLRYSLLPYMYSIAHDITTNAGSMMRALSMDFPKDEKTHDLGTQFMFGKSLLVAPVTDSMYVHRKNGEAKADFSKTGSRNVYLPKGTDWYDFWTGEKITGGQEITKKTPIDIIPLYIKAGSIVPWGPDVQYAGERNWDNLNIYIYPGEDAEFVLYEDEGDNYNYEKGISSAIRMKWDDKNRSLVIGAREGEYPGMLKKRKFRVTLINEGDTISQSVAPGSEISYIGREISVKL